MVAISTNQPQKTDTGFSTNLSLATPSPTSTHAHARDRTIRGKVLLSLEALTAHSTDAVTGAMIAKHAGLEYKQTVDALNIMFNMDRVERVGHKFVARWRAKRPAVTPRYRDPFIDIPFLRNRAAASQADTSVRRRLHI
jgi:hypothetical protein